MNPVNCKLFVRKNVQTIDGSTVTIIAGILNGTAPRMLQEGIKNHFKIKEDGEVLCLSISGGLDRQKWSNALIIPSVQDIFSPDDKITVLVGVLDKDFSLLDDESMHALLISQKTDGDYEINIVAKEFAPEMYNLDIEQVLQRF